jgi:tetratricopeptide (TPR) repeat protein
VGVVDVPLPEGVMRGAPVRIYLRISGDKKLSWWYSVAGGPRLAAAALLDPWTPERPVGRTKALVDHRQEVRRRLDATSEIPLDLEVQEAAYLYQSGRVDEADLLLRDLGRPTTDALVGRYENLRALVASDLRRPDEALEAARAACAGEARSGVFEGNLGVLLADLGRPTEAVPHLRAAIARDPSLVYAYEHLARVLRAAGDEASALRELREAEAQARKRALRSPDDAEAWRSLVRILRGLGDYPAAAEAEARASEAAKNETYSGDHTLRIAGPDSGFLHAKDLR